jgi:2-C-methyl-D-erythritol 4-phosphate cytidylyltransferase
MIEYSVIITAGGIGRRMGRNVPKQFIKLADKPILIHTLERFYSFNPSVELIITLPDEWISYWQELLINFQCDIPHQVISGGKERYHSIKNALNFCHGTYILIHDGVRPFVSNETLANCFSEVISKGQVIPIVPIKESIREITINGDSKSVMRKNYCLVQTPQCFKREVLQQAYENPYKESITDDASLVELAGFHIHLIEGNEENIKITTAMDLLIAEQLLLK